ncbi:glucosyltransferase domain-containing protein [Vagococcus elongatus]|uniref:Glucosyl transferase GtrII n=1 Tax=Vagococcus elongatus TaxID=180344 RepID=A0A430B1W7_9ENTE|nr:glucosyltransferase domain-containing protein [Vagococcus elongatus]RSU14310.1 hypothetical protein CBF29_03140 [Vagococcus elongatus]
MMRFFSKSNGFLSFIKNNVSLTIFTFILTFALYSIKLVNRSFGMDTNTYITDYHDYLNHWYSISRFGEVFLKKLLWGPYTNIYLLNFLAIILFALSSLLICYLFTEIVDNEHIKYYMFIIPSLFLTSTFFVAQFYFVLQNFEYTLAMAFVILSVILIQQQTADKIFTIMKYAGAVLLLTFSIAVYQTFILFFVILVAALFLLEIRESFEKNQPYCFRKLFYRCLPYVLILLISVASYFVFDKLLLNYLALESKQHAENMMIWKSAGFKEGIVSLRMVLQDIIFKPNDLRRYLVYNFGFLATILLLIPLMGKFLLAKNKYFLTTLVCLVTLFVGGLGVAIAMGALPTPRSMAPQFPFLLAFLFFYISLCYKNKYLKIFIIGLVLFFGVTQFKTSSNSLFSEQMTYEEDERKMIQIDQSIKNLQLENADSYKLIIIGTSPSTNKFNLNIFSDLVGLSMFQFGESEQVGSYYITLNIISIMDSLGMSYNNPTLQEYMDVWKNKTTLENSKVDFGIEVIDDFIIVKIA